VACRQPGPPSGCFHVAAAAPGHTPRYSPKTLCGEPPCAKMALFFECAAQGRGMAGLPDDEARLARAAKCEEWLCFGGRESAHPRSPAWRRAGDRWRSAGRMCGEPWRPPGMARDVMRRMQCVGRGVDVAAAANRTIVLRALYSELEELSRGLEREGREGESQACRLERGSGHRPERFRRIRRSRPASRWMSQPETWQVSEDLPGRGTRSEGQRRAQRRRGAACCDPTALRCRCHCSAGERTGLERRL